MAKSFNSLLYTAKVKIKKNDEKKKEIVDK